VRIKTVQTLMDIRTSLFEQHIVVCYWLKTLMLYLMLVYPGVVTRGYILSPLCPIKKK